MIFKTLPEHVRKEVIALTKDEIFQERFKTDSKLDELEALKNNKNEEIIALKNIIDRKHNKFLTLSMWAFLWTIDSPLINQNKEIKEQDIDLFLFLIENGTDLIHDLDKLFDFSKDFCKNNNIDTQKAYLLIKHFISSAFRPLMLFPQNNTEKHTQEACYDAEWLTSIVAAVNAVTGYRPEFIINKLSITECCYYFVQYAKKQGATGIYKRNTHEVNLLIDRRACELIAERLIEKGIIKDSEKDYYINEMVVKEN